MADTPRDFNLRKQQAADALREMSRRAATHRGDAPAPRSTDTAPAPPAVAAGGFLPINLNFLKLDNDTLLILGILLILSSEKTDKLLLLALVYILM